MAESASHKWGQMIGDFLEEVFEKELKRFAQKHNLFLDKKGPRRARPTKKVSWMDTYGNSHDLDFVLERGGTEDSIGEPIAFIESAWRRYTKHSRNKAQEIQGAILPLVVKHQRHAPFIGVVLAGAFTEGALSQLRSLGFTILYFPYSVILQGFAAFGINADSEENTLEIEFQQKIEAWRNFKQREALAQKLLQLNRQQIKKFFTSLEKAVQRQIITITVTPLHGVSLIAQNIDQAIDLLKYYPSPSLQALPVLRYEISIHYSNGDSVNASFSNVENATSFLSSYNLPKPRQ